MVLNWANLEDHWGNETREERKYYGFRCLYAIPLPSCVRSPRSCSRSPSWPSILPSMRSPGSLPSARLSGRFSAIGFSRRTSVARDGVRFFHGVFCAFLKSCCSAGNDNQNVLLDLVLSNMQKAGLQAEALEYTLNRHVFAAFATTSILSCGFSQS